MIGKFIHGRTVVFIDAANVFYSQRSLGWQVDYRKLKKYLKSECDLQDIRFYTARIGNNEGESSFLNKLEFLGYKVVTKAVKRIRLRGTAFQWKGNLDVELVIDVLENIEAFDTLILMSGDSDFAPLLDTVRNRGKQVLVMSTKNHVSVELLERAKYINLKKLKDSIARI